MFRVFDISFTTIHGIDLPKTYNISVFYGKTGRNWSTNVVNMLSKISLPVNIDLKKVDSKITEPCNIKLCAFVY
jgi:hypothetical protein